MKKYALLAALCLSINTLFAAPELVYYLPLTQIKVEVCYDEITTAVGPFYQYSERYLATKNVITKDETTYELKHIGLGQQNVADEQQPYTIDLSDPIAQANCINLSDKGILLGVNLLPNELQAAEHTCTRPKCETKTDKADLTFDNGLPLLEDGMRAASVAKMAESAAKQIYRIREARLSLISGDTEQMPQDLQAALAELNREEAELVALFIGKRNVTHRKSTLYYTPELATDTTFTLFRFSRFAGIVASEDLSGAPVTLSLKAHAITEPATPIDQKTTLLTPFHYVVAGQADATIHYNEQVLAEKHLTIPQFGYVTALPASLFKSKKIVTVLYNKFGGIQSIHK